MKFANGLTALAIAVALVAVPAEPAVAQPAPAALPTAPVAPQLASIWNFRDVAGSGVVLADGTTMVTGWVYRSGRLAGLSETDSATLTALGVTDIYDLRTAGAAKGAPDPVVAGATRHLIDVFAGHHSGFRGSTTKAARAFMRRMNREFVTSPAQRKRIAQVLTAISTATTPVLIHCTEGKDRSGWVSAMLLKVAGADRATIIEQYLLSNSYRRQLIDARVADALAAHGSRRAAVVSELETLRGSYLAAGLDTATSKYGSLTGYLTRGLKLSKATIAALRAHLRQPHQPA